MSQVSNTGTSYSNNSGSITPWNRTPGKPGITSGGSFSSTHWPSNKSNSISLNPEQDEDSVEQVRRSSIISSSTQGTNHTSNSNNASTSSGTVSTTPTSDPSGTSGSGVLTIGSAAIGSTNPGSYANPKNSDSGQMWPPPIFDPPRLPDPTSQHPDSSLTINQWPGVPFSSSSLGAVGSLLGSPNTFTNVTQPSNPWPLGASSSNSSSVPRAITGQQLNPLNTNVETIPNSSDHARRFVNWTLGGDQEPLNEDRTGLSLPLSNLNMNTNPSSSNFNNLSDYVEGNNLGASASGNPTGSDNLSDFGANQVLQKKSSTDSDNPLTCDTEEAIRSAVNTTEPWGLHPVDQSTPWNFPESNGDSMGASPSGACVSPSMSDSTLGARASSNAILDANSPGSQQPMHSRRINSISSAMNRDLESNVWPSEPPNGTGIWESHYESLGERTARWQQQSANSAANAAVISQPSFQPHYISQPNFAPDQLSHPVVRSRPQSGQLPPTTENTPYFRAMSRGAPSNIFPMVHPSPNCTAPLSMGTRPLIMNPHQLTSNLGSNNSRAFPLGANTGNLGPGGSWSTTNTTENAMPSLNIGNKNRWPNPNMNRMTGKQPQQQPVTHILPSQNPNGLRWPPIPPGNPSQVSNAWAVNDQRRPPGVLPGPWSQAPVGNDPNTTASYFNQPPQIPPPRGSQHSSTSEFPSSIIPANPRGSGGATNQAFRPPQNSLYSTVNPGFSSSSMSQRMYLSPQQHSIQLQQQSLLRAQLMRQLANLGFTENEVQSVFADSSINVERALIDLRDRTGHPGLDEVINSVKRFSGMLLPSSTNMDDGLGIDPTRQDLSNSGGRSITSRSSQSTIEAQTSKPMGSLPTENLELSLHLLQQRETQILQAIMQLHSKHQELIQKINQIRQANVPFATNSMLLELQLQSVQVAHQIDAQQAQLKHVRSQAGSLKQIPVSSNQPMQQQHTPAVSAPLMQISPSNTSNLTIMGNPSWTSGHSGANPMATKINQGQSLVNPVVCGSESLDSIAQEQNYSMNLSGSLPWESGPWSGTGPQVSEGYSSNGNPLSADRRWSASGLSGRSPFASSQIPSLGDPRWSDNTAEAVNNSSQQPNSLLCDTRRSLGDVDDLRSGSGANATSGISNASGSDLNQASNPIASKSWILVHNIPPHISAGMIKLTVSTALANSDKCTAASTTTTSGTGAGGSDVPEFEFHPNMSARWILLGLSNTADASVVHDCLEGNGGVQPSGYYGSIKFITPNEAILRLQDIQSLASRIKSLGSDVPLRSGCQSNNLVDFAGISADLAGNTHLSSLSIAQSTTTSTTSEPNTEINS